MNHSCNPNVICSAISDTQYKCVALRDIKIGDEIVCDYALFDYECDGHEIPSCECGETNCRGAMKGFKNLPFETQLRLLPWADSAILENFVRDNNLTYVGDLICPGSAEIRRKNENAYMVVSLKDFKAGDIVYTNNSLICDKDYDA